ncbi:MAG: hypothetical protein WB791_05320 [Waddliaceae bacterium]
MGIVLAVKKKNEICIAADSMSISGGSRKLTSDHIINGEKIISCGSSYIGIADHPVWPLVMKSYFNQTKQILDLESKEKIFEEWLQMHRSLKDKYFLSPSDDNEDAFESSRFESIIVNSSGIFKTYELRSIQKFIYFTAIGSGASYAFGAMHALYDRLDTAEEIAKTALNTVIEFDESSGYPVIFYKVKTK